MLLPPSFAKQTKQGPGFARNHPTTAVSAAHLPEPLDAGCRFARRLQARLHWISRSMAVSGVRNVVRQLQLAVVCVATEPPWASPQAAGTV